MSNVVVQAVEWSTLKDVDDVEPITDKDHDILAEIRDIVIKHGYQNRFGVCLLHKHFDIAANEVALETTDVERRISVVQVVPANDHLMESSLQTSWRFVADEVQNATVCRKQCNPVGTASHRQEHIKWGI